MDHIIGDRKNNSRENLEGLCPNCHSQTPTYKNRMNKNIGKQIYSDNQIIEALQNNISAYSAMQSLGMNPHGGHYIRFRNIIKKYNVVLNYTV